MAVSTVLDVGMTIAEDRDAAWLAGALGAGDNTLALFVAALGADTLITKGWQQALGLGLVVAVTVFITTVVATKWSSAHIKNKD